MSDTRRDITRQRVLVSGRVHGVNFRSECTRVARAGDVAGRVRNLPDGRVEAVFEGEAGAVARMVSWCEVGPRLAAVRGVDVHDEVPTGESGFRVR